jgi:hypothetical protein
VRLKGRVRIARLVVAAPLAATLSACGQSYTLVWRLDGSDTLHHRSGYSKAACESEALTIETAGRGGIGTAWCVKE